MEVESLKVKVSEAKKLSVVEYKESETYLKKTTGILFAKERIKL